MAINKKLIHFKSKEKFNEELANANIKDTSIVFIQDSKEIWTHQQFYATPLTVEEIEVIVANSPTTEELLANIAAETSAREKAIEDTTTELTELITLELNRAQSAEETLTTNLSNEITRSTAQDEAHDAAIAKEVSDRETAITTEVNDRNNAIKVETDRAVAAEGTLQSNINTLDNELDAEVSRATNAEQALQTAIDTEVSRAKAAETELDGKITNHTTITDAALALKADKADTYTKAQVDQKVSGSYKVKGSSTFENLPTEGNVVGDVYNITNIFTLDDVEYPVGTNVVYTEEGWDALSGVFDTTKLEGDIQTVADDITKETVRAEAAEATLGTSIQTETSNREAANLMLQSNIDSVNTALSEEVSRAKAAEQLNASDITTLAGRVTTNETKLGVVQGDENTTGSINKALKDAKSYTDSIVEGLDATVSGTDKNITVSVIETDGKLVNVTVKQDDPTVATSGEYMYGQDSSENPVKVSNSDLASVMAELMGTNGLFPYDQRGTWNGSLDDIKSEGMYTFTNTETTGLPYSPDSSSYGILIYGKDRKSNVGGNPEAQILYYHYPEARIYSRVKWSQTWHDWQRLDNFGYNTQSELEAGIEQVDWYGVSWSENDSDPTCTRIGNMAMHRSLPILSAMLPFYIGVSGSIGLYSDVIVPVSADHSSLLFSSTQNSSIAINTSTFSGSVFIRIPEFWYTDDYISSTKTHNLKISQTAKAGWRHHKEAYVGAYEGYDNGTRYLSQKGYIPTVSVTREHLRSRARVSGIEGEHKWNIYTYEEHRAICHLFLVEYATRNSQAPVNSSLTAEGFRQGGLGSGCTTGTMNNTYSFIPTGTTDSLGNGSGQVAYTASNDTTYYANRYRGIENPFGHIWKHCDDVISIYHDSYQMRTWYKCEDPSQFATNKNSAYKSICSRAIPSNGYKKEIAATINCDFFAESTGGSESTYWCDYNYDNTDTSEHCLLIGGRSANGGMAGLFYLASDNGVGHSHVSIGSRLTYLPWAK